MKDCKQNRPWLEFKFNERKQKVNVIVNDYFFENVNGFIVYWEEKKLVMRNVQITNSHKELFNKRIYFEEGMSKDDLEEFIFEIWDKFK